MSPNNTSTSSPPIAQVQPTWDQSPENQSEPLHEPPPYDIARRTSARLPAYSPTAPDPSTEPRSSSGTRRPLTAEQRMQLLREFQHEKEHSVDYWGGHKGSASGPPKDPFKVFRWAARKMSHDDDPSKRPPGSPERWYDRSRSVVEYAEDGEVAEGDIDSHNVA